MKDIAIEVLTPAQRNMNIEVKALRKILEEYQGMIDDLSKKHQTTQKTLDEMSATIFRDLKNNDNENQLLSFELKRMQHLDRLKVKHANDHFYNPNQKTCLPSLDSAYASINLLDKKVIAQSQRASLMAQTPVPMHNYPSREFATMVSDTEMVTQQELKGVCERFAKQPSQRQRIIITRS